MTEHMPSAHRRYASWTPVRMLSFAAQVGPSTAALVETIMHTKPHPEQGFWACLGILQLAKTLWRSAAGGGLPARPDHRREDLRLDRLDPEDRSRPGFPGGRGAGRGPSAAREHPRPRLLPLTRRSNAPLRCLSSGYAAGTLGNSAHPTQERLAALGLTGMARALDDQRRQPDIATLSFEERLAMLLDRETMERDNKRLVARLRFAALRQEAIVEDVDLQAVRGLDRALFQKLAAGDWIDRKQNLLVIGPTGVGKSWIACALGHKACRDNRSVAYHRVPRLLEALALARGDGRYSRLLKALGRVQLLILDDWGLAPLTSEQRRDLLEIMDDRHERGSTIVTSQVPVDHWHEVIGDPTIADAVLDRLVHNAHRLILKGGSLRKRAAKAIMLDAEPAT